MTTCKAVCIACIFFCLCAVPTFAQYTVKKIVFDGTVPYSQADLEAASGLKPGDALNQEKLQQTAQKLVDTGAFGDLQVTLEGAVKATSVIFKVKPIEPDHQLTVTFDNLVWFTPAELQTGLHARVPLYGTTLPESGNLQDAVETALADMLKEKGVTATLAHTVFEPSPTRQARIVAYRVASPSIVLQSVHLEGVTPTFAIALHNQEAKIVGRPVHDGIEYSTSADVLLAPYLTAGYLNAQLSDRVLTPTVSSPERIDVALKATIDSGVPFHIGDLTWAGSPEMSSAAFAAAIPLHPGDLASNEALAKSADLLAASYRKEGYNDVIVSQTPTIEAAVARVSYAFHVAPGEIYHVRSITPVHLTPAQQNDYNRGWLLKTGDAYNPEYIQTFLKQNTALQSFEGCSAAYKANSDPETHLVDVVVTFACRSARPGN